MSIATVRLLSAVTSIVFCGYQELAIGCFNGEVYYFELDKISKNDLKMRWRTNRSDLIADEVELEGAKGLSALNRRLLEQKGFKPREELRDAETVATSALTPQPKQASHISDSSAAAAAAAAAATPLSIIQPNKELQTMLITTELSLTQMRALPQEIAQARADALMPAGASPNQSQLWQKVINGAPDAVKCLQADDTLMQRTDNCKNNLLHLATMTNHMGLLSHLLEVGVVALNAKNQWGLQPLHIAAFLGNAAMVRALLDQAAPMETVNLKISREVGDFSIACTPFHLAIFRGDILTVRHFLADKCLQSYLEVPGIGNLLHLAILAFQNDVLKLLIQTRELPRNLLNQPNGQLMTPLSFAAALSNRIAIRILVDSGKVNVNLANTEGRNALHFAALYGQQESAEELVLADIDLLKLDSNTLFPLQVALQELPRHQQDLVMADRFQACIAFLNNTAAYKAKFANRKPDVRRLTLRNLTIKGGGPTGLAYLGAIKALEETKALVTLKRVAGTSAGAITAALLALGYCYEELLKILEAKPLGEFLQGVNAATMQTTAHEGGVWNSLKMLWEVSKAAKKQQTSNLAFLNPLGNLLAMKGLCDGEDFRKWMEGLIQKKLTQDKVDTEFGKHYVEFLTFGQLKELIQKGKPYKHLYTITTEIGQQHNITVINSEDDPWKDVIISDAVRASMSIPGVFFPHQLHSKTIHPDHRVERVAWSAKRFVDGGMLCNDPQTLFDKFRYVQPNNPIGDPNFPVFNAQTISLSLFNPDDQKLGDVKAPPTDAKAMAVELINIYLAAEQLLANLQGFQEARRISISGVGVGMLDFNLSDEKKRELIASGESAVRAFFGTSVSPVTTLSASAAAATAAASTSSSSSLSTTSSALASGPVPYQPSPDDVV
jgi:NTE family protein